MEHEIRNVIKTMNNNYEELKKKFPDMYENVYCGCDHPVGWNALVMELSEKLNVLPIAIRVAQTKEKYGGLRFYVDYYNDSYLFDGKSFVTIADELINEAEQKSFTICQDCGTGGRLYTDGWNMTLCENCATIRNRKLDLNEDSPFWIQTFTGKRFDLLNPTIDMICLKDIAISLSNLCRYTGSISYFYSVAEHSINVSSLLDDDLKVYGLLHDAAEAYIGDINSPLKSIINKLTNGRLRQIENRIQDLIFEKFNLDDKYDKDSVHNADIMMLITEHKQLFENDLEWECDKELSYTHIKLNLWHPITAYSRFIAECAEFGLKDT